ncbi:MAG: anthranilate synthase component I [Gammaproteobacteria bacterium]|nr:anthranilate synthase component I [Gammaproteobacteria bacterium]
MNHLSQTHFTTAGGVRVTHQQQACDGASEMCRRLSMLDDQLGMAMHCGVDYPGRYRRHQLIFVNPPLQVTARRRELHIKALNNRGELLLHECRRALAGAHQHFQCQADDAAQLIVRVAEPAGVFAEEMRTRQSSVFSVLRQLITHFACTHDPLPGLYGAFAYDLAFQFEPVQQRLHRSSSHRDLVLYLPDEILSVDSESGAGVIHRYDFVCRDADGDPHTTGGLRRQGDRLGPRLASAGKAMAGVSPLHQQSPAAASDHAPGEYAAVVDKARARFSRGDLFEVVPGQTFSTPLRCLPSTLFQRLVAANPAPYSALINLGEQEYLVCASPEMFVRVRPDAVLGDLVETCPISGTIARGADAIEDADHIRQLLNSSKDEAELSMCTDVDRNDKSRVCVTGSVNIVGRRQVELYSRLIHTVDHVQGRLQKQFDALDAFLSHTWAVTVTGAPKQHAMQFIEDHEKTPRRWYGGAFGRLGFDGAMDTGLTIRTVHIDKEVACVRAGATLLQDSDPLAEEQETRLKASALLSVLQPEATIPATIAAAECDRAAVSGAGLRVLMVDHQDSFVHTLAAGFRAAGAELVTLRPSAARQALATQAFGKQAFDLVILSPGPGRPEDFDCRATLALCDQLDMPVFGVCLGLQAMIEYAGGELALLSRPVHGSASAIVHEGSNLFGGIDSPFRAGRYHSIHAGQVPAGFVVSARSADDQCVMAIEHEHRPWSAVQFHPESLLTLANGAGQQLIQNVVRASVLRRQLTSTQRVGGYHG